MARIGLTREQAVEAAKAAGVNYAVYGDCTAFYNVAPLTFRYDRAGLQVEFVSVTGEVVYREDFWQASWWDGNLVTPEQILGKLAIKIAKQTRTRW